MIAAKAFTWYSRQYFVLPMAAERQQFRVRTAVTNQRRCIFAFCDKNGVTSENATAAVRTQVQYTLLLL